MSDRFALVIVIEARDAGEAGRFAGDMLCGGVRWDRPLPVPYVGEAFAVGTARRYRTAEIHLLEDGMRKVVPGCG